LGFRILLQAATCEYILKLKSKIL